MQSKRRSGWWPRLRAWWAQRGLGRAGATPRHGPAHLQTGAWGEAQAAAYLRQQGMKILAERVRINHRKEELDLVAREGKVLVFVEVKTRASEQFGRPFVAVNAAKRRHVTRAGLAYVRQLRRPPRHFRFDVVEVIGRPDGETPPKIRHIRNAFTLPRNCRYA